MLKNRCKKCKGIVRFKFEYKVIITIVIVLLVLFLFVLYLGAYPDFYKRFVAGATEIAYPVFMGEWGSTDITEFVNNCMSSSAAVEESHHPSWESQSEEDKKDNEGEARNADQPSAVETNEAVASPSFWTRHSKLEAAPRSRCFFCHPV